jgi:hypothetical protein
LLLVFFVRRRKGQSQDTKDVELSHYEDALRNSVTKPSTTIDDHYATVPGFAGTPSAMGLLLTYDMIKEEKELGKEQDVWR